MGKRLYVGNLPFDADEAAIRTAFSEAGGTVAHVHIPLDRETQRPRGFAFVEMATDEEAMRAIEAMNGATLGTRTMRVSEAEDRRSAPGGGPRPRRDGGASRGGAPAGGVGSDPGQRAREARERRFGPDARPSRERQWDRGGKRGGSRRRGHDFGGGRRGGGGNDRFDDYDD
ncbi:MAG TPA: RNA-binding protein [bacterium]|nr:RNA-binding protein [bacterium]